MISTGVLCRMINAGIIRLSNNITVNMRIEIITLFHWNVSPKYAEILNILQTEAAAIARDTEHIIIIVVYAAHIFIQSLHLMPHMKSVP